MGKTFQDDIKSGNNFKPSFGLKGPLKVKPDDVLNHISTEIKVKQEKPGESSNEEISTIIEQNELTIEQMSKEIALLKSQNKKLNQENNELLKKIEQRPIVKSSKSSQSFYEKMEYSDLTANAQKLVKAIYQNSEKNEWVQISRRELIHDYKIHVSHLTSAKIEAKEKGLIDIKENFTDGTKRPVVFFKYLKPD
jgi:hypothetical protein